ncbi:MAG: TonB-dependent receptor [Pseudomonadota bacterium]|nr:TonB-dependent receptor [Pseudomonadota bacterium]
MACVSVAPAQPPARVAVVDLLRKLIASGVDVVYSSELVPSNLDAPDAYPQGDPMSRIMAALAVNHLTLKPTGEQGYVVTRAAPPSSPTPTPSSAPAATLAAGSTAGATAALDEVSVFASRYQFTIGTESDPIGFDEREIEQMPGGRIDPVRALRAAPGLATNISARPYVRGALLDDVLVEYDGIALAEPFHFRSFQSVMSIFNPSTVNRADIFTGGFPVNYGTRSAGVIDLVPRSVESGYEYGVGASLLSYDLETVGRSANHPIEWLVVARLSSDDRVLQRLLGEKGEPEFYDVVGHVRWSVDASSALTLGWIALDDKVTFKSAEENAVGLSRDYTSWLRWDWTPIASVRSLTSVAAAKTERYDRGALTLPGFTDGRLRAERSFADISLRSDWTYTPSPALRWSFGGEFTHENADLLFLRQQLIATPIAAAFGRPLDAAVDSDQTPSSSMAGLYASAHRRWKAFEAEVGVRADAQAYRDFGVRSQVAPRVNLRYDITDSWRTYGSWGHFTQAQRVDEYRVEANQATPDAANRAVHLIGGVAYENADAVNWRVEGYRDHWATISPYFDNALAPLSLLPQLEADRVLVVPADADAAGLEMSVQRSFSRGVSAWGSYALSRVTDDINGRETPRSWDQEHAANAGIAWTGPRTSASVFVVWHSGWPRTPLTVIPATVAVPAYLAVGARNSERWGNYFSGDLRLSTSLPFQSGSLSLWLDVTNLTNRSNYCCVDLNPMVPASGVPTMGIGAWSPRTVNVGFSWKVRRP